jgi:dTDP-4-amino-4,6-dideoxygalactose transaminase
MQTMLDAGVATRRGIMCAHREPAYAQEPWRCGKGAECAGKGAGCACLRESERAHDTCITLPLFHQMTETEQDYVVETLKEACEQ